MLRFIGVLAFLFMSAGCFSTINKAAQDGGVEADDSAVSADGQVAPDAAVEDAGDETPDVVIADAGHPESDAQAPIPDATTPLPDATPAPDAQPSDAQVSTPDIGDTHDAAPPPQDATPPVPDATSPASTCENDRNCGPRGGICTDGTCRVTPAWSVWCWDHTPPDGRPTCHNVDGYSSPDVWRLADHPDGPPACQGPNPDHFPVAECCRGSREWNNEESDDFRWCEQQPDGSSMTWDPYNDD